MRSTAIIAFVIVLLMCVAFVAGRYSAMAVSEATREAVVATAVQEKQALYWYDPMYPQQHFDKPGKSPFMEMELVPKFADEENDGNGVKIDAQMQQNLGIRLATVTRQIVTPELRVSAMLQFNQRDVSIVQTRVAGFVTATANVAPGDRVRQGQMLLRYRAPEWTSAMQEWLVLQSNSNAQLHLSATQRLQQLGLTDADIAKLKTSGEAAFEFSIVAPQTGVIESLEVRNGMTLMAGQTIAKITSDDPLWLELAVPQKYAAYVAVGQMAKVHFITMSDRAVNGQIKRILPALDERSSNVRVQLELPNRRGELRAGMVAQVDLRGREHEALVVPTESIIRSGKRNVVIVSDNESFTPAVVELGAEYGDVTEIVNGIEEEQTVVRSGQFLIDSEANLSGVIAKLNSAEPGHD